MKARSTTPGALRRAGRPGLPRPQLGDDAGGIEGRAWRAGCWRRCAPPSDRSGVKARRACWIRLPSCPQHAVGNVGRALGHEVDTHPFERMSRTTSSIFSSSALGASLNRGGEPRRRRRPARVSPDPHLGQLFEQLGEQPEQEAGIEPAGLGQLARGQHVDGRDRPRRSAAGPECPAWARRRSDRPRALQGEQVAQDGADGGGGHVAVAGGEGLGVVPANCTMARRSFRSSSSSPRRPPP